MNEFIDKLIERLEEKKGIAFLTLANTGNEAEDMAYNEVMAYLNNAIKIVNELAEEYKLSEMPTGWIACKEEMPEVGKDVLCVKESGDIVIAQWGGEESSYLDEKAVWFLRRGWCRKNHIIAWMPLPPAPYTEGE